MHLKKIFLICISILSVAAMSAQTRYAKIVVYRNENTKDKNEETYKIFANENLTTSLTNYHFEEFYMPDGSFKLKVNEIYATVRKVECVAGRTYYFRIYRNMSLLDKPITIEATDSITAINDLKYLKSYFVSKPKIANVIQKNGIGIIIEPGVGFEKVEMITTTAGTAVMHSFGGGALFGVSYNREVSDYFGWSAELSHQSSILSPHITNGDITFTQGVLSATPYFTIPVTIKNEQRIKLGGGVDYRFNPILNFETEKITGGINDKWTYGNVFGYHLIAFYEGKLGPYLRGHIGLKYNDARFSYLFGEKYQPSDPLLKNPHANSLGISFGVEYCF
jgi:hypothetical protein